LLSDKRKKRKLKSKIRKKRSPKTLKRKKTHKNPKRDGMPKHRIEEATRREFKNHKK